MMCLNSFGQPALVLDPAFQPVLTQTGGRLTAVTLLPDDGFLVAADYVDARAVAQYGIARLDSDGRLEWALPLIEVAKACNPRTGLFTNSHQILSVRLQGTDHVIVSGYFTSILGAAQPERTFMEQPATARRPFPCCHRRTGWVDLSH